MDAEERGDQQQRSWVLLWDLFKNGEEGGVAAWACGEGEDGG